MPSKSKSQQRLFGMALAVRKGEMKRSEAGKEVLDIVDGDMSDREIEKFAKHRTSDRERVSEGQDPQEDPTKKAEKIPNRLGDQPKKADSGKSPLETYLKNLRYAGRMRPIIDVRPEEKYVFVVVKPGFSDIAKDVIDRFSDAGFSLYKTRTKMLSLREAKQLYKVHKDEDFYNNLCKYMSSDFSIGILFWYPSNWDTKEAFSKVDKLKDEIRKEYQESDMRNAMHSSDNLQNMRYECSMYFNELF